MVSLSHRRRAIYAWTLDFEKKPGRRFRLIKHFQRIGIICFHSIILLDIVRENFAMYRNCTFI